jgi:hypothetical protein
MAVELPEEFIKIQNSKRKFTLRASASLTGKNSGTPISYDTKVYNSSNKLVDYTITPPLFLSDASSLKFQYSHEYSYPFEEALAKTGNTGKKVLSLLNQMNAIAGSLSNDLIAKQEVITPVYRKLPSWKTTQNLVLPNSIQFIFQYGYMGFYSGRIEVFEPIINIAAYFAAREGLAGKLTELPLPLSGSIIAGIASYLIKGADDVQEPADGDPPPDPPPPPPTQEEGGIIGSVFNKVSNLVATFNKAASSKYVKQKAMCNGSIGRIYIPTFTVGGAEWAFDFSNVDEEGYPCSGTLSLTDCVGVEVANKALIEGIEN